MMNLICVFGFVECLLWIVNFMCVFRGELLRWVSC